MLQQKLQPIVADIFIRGRKLSIFIVSITQSYIAVLKNIWIDFKHYFLINILSKQEIQKIGIKYSSDIDFKEYIRNKKIRKL